MNKERIPESFATYQITASENLRFASAPDVDPEDRCNRIQDCEFWAKKAFIAAGDNPFERLHAMMMYQTAVSMKLLMEAEVKFHNDVAEVADITESNE